MTIIRPFLIPIIALFAALACQNTDTSASTPPPTKTTTAPTISAPTLAPTPTHIIPLPAATSAATQKEQTIPTQSFTPLPTLAPDPTLTQPPTITPAPTRAPTYTPSPTPSPIPKPTPTPDGNHLPPPQNLLQYESGHRLTRIKPDITQTLLDLPWIRDGLSTKEKETLQYLVYLAPDYAADFRLLLEKPWVQDGTSKDELDVMGSLYSIAYEDPKRTDLLTQMPFLDSIESHDRNAIYVLDHVSYNNPSAFRKIVDNPGYNQAITDHHARIIAVMDGPARLAQAILEQLLDTEKVFVESATIRLPYTGYAQISIIRTQKPFQTRSQAMTMLIQSVKTADELTQHQLPVTYIPLLFSTALPEGSEGANFGTNITVKPSLDSSDYTSHSHRIIAHEVAHFYWSGNKTWLDEGLAELYAEITLQEHANDKTCRQATKLQELDDQATDCHYVLGLGIFRELRELLGDKEFKNSINRLYVQSQTRDPEIDYQYPKLGLAHLAKAFRRGAQPYTVDKINAIINKWYGPVPHENNR